MGVASLWGGIGNGNGAGGGDAPSALADADIKIAELNRIIGRLNEQANEILIVSTGLLDQFAGSPDKADLRLMLVEIAHQRDETVRRLTELTEARRHVAESEETGGGGMIFGLGALGIVPALLVGLVALVAAAASWIAATWNAIDARNVRLAEMRLTENTRRADRGLPPMQPGPGEGGILAGVSDVVGKAGWALAAVFLGPPLIKALFGGRRKRHAT